MPPAPIAVPPSIKTLPASCRAGSPDQYVTLAITGLTYMVNANRPYGYAPTGMVRNGPQNGPICPLSPPSGGHAD